MITWWLIKKFRAWFKDSEVLIFARLQVLIAFVLGVLEFAWPLVSGVDPSLFLGDNQKYIAGWLLFSGLVTEGLRRFRDEHLEPTVEDEPMTDETAPAVAQPEPTPREPPITGIDGLPVEPLPGPAPVVVGHSNQFVTVAVMFAVGLTFLFSSWFIHRKVVEVTKEVTVEVPAVCPVLPKRPVPLPPRRPKKD